MPERDVTIIPETPAPLDEAATLLGVLGGALKRFSSDDVARTALLAALAGAGLIGFSTAEAYPANTVGERMAALSSLTDALKGAKLVGYLPPWAGAVGADAADHLNDSVNIKRFGLRTTNTGAQNVTAWNAAMAYAVTQSAAGIGVNMHIPRGLYDFDGNIVMGGANNLRISGDGIDATRLRITHPTANFLTAWGDIYQGIDNLTLTSSVTRTAGAMFNTTGFWRRGFMFRVKIEKHFNGVDLFNFEQCALMETFIVSPTGLGTGLIAGNAAVSNQGAGLNLVSVFIRGNDELVPEGPAVGARGIMIFDCEAVYGYSVDVSATVNESMVVSPTFRSAFCFFTSCYFDVTVTGDNILFQGAGAKDRFQFSNCWFSGAGRFDGGAADKFGVRLGDVGTYADIKFTGSQFAGTSGPGLGAQTPQPDVLVTGCTFNNCGLNTTLDTAVYASFGAVQTKSMQFSNCKFIPSAVTKDFLFTSNSRGNIITGCEMLRGLSYQGGAQFGAVSGNSDPNTSDTVASAGTMQIPVTKTSLDVSGTTAIGGLFRTFTGHRVDFTMLANVTWNNGGALVLRGGVNFAAVAGNVLTLRCRPDGTWQEVSRSA